MLRRLTLALTALAVFMVASPFAAGREGSPPAVVVRKLSAREIAGRSVAEAVWGRPVSLRGFVNLKGDGLPTQQTEVRLAYDDDNLYVYLRCLEESMDKLVAEYLKHDDKIWRDDSVTIFFDTRHDHDTHFHMIANVAGAKYEEKDKMGVPDTWDGEWSVEIKKGDHAWAAQIVIPFRSMGVQAPKEGDVWGANFCRRERPKDETTCWAPAISSFHEPERWGHIIFGDSNSPIVSAAPLHFSVPGKYPFTVHVSNPTAAPIFLRARTLLDGKQVGVVQRRFRPGKTEWRFDLKYPYDGDHKLSVEVLDFVEYGTVVSTPAVRLKIEPYLTRLDKYRQVVRALEPVSAAGKAEMSSVRVALGELVSLAGQVQGSVEKWGELGERLDRVEKSVSHLRYVCADKEGKGYVLGVETPLRKVFRDGFFEGKVGGTAQISACRNEYEAFQVVVIAYERQLEDVSVSVMELIGPGGARMRPENVTLNLVEYVKTRKPRYEVDYVGWWPDPLMDMKPFDVPAGSIQPVWITVHPTEDISAGIYEGRVIIKPSNAPESAVPLAVRVWDFSLPKTGHLKTAFALFEHELGAWYGGMTQEIKRAYYQFLLEHRINPTNIYTSKPIPEKDDLPFCIERGLNALCLAYTHNRDEKDRAELAAMIMDYELFLRENGWWDRAYIYGFDEIPPEKYGELRDMYGWVKKESPDLPRVCTVIPNRDLKGYVDIWVPVTSNFKQKDAEEYTKAGDEVWWYVCCNPHHPYPNFFIDYPAIDPRVLFWMNWKYRVPGFLYYAINLWHANRTLTAAPNEIRPLEDPEVREAMKAGKRWPEVPWNTFSFDDFNGDGQLIYPGPGGKPLSSIRFECIRDGIEDYEYFHMLNDLIAKAERPGSKADPAVLAKAGELLAVRDVVQSLTEYALDPDVLLRTREAAARAIEALSKTPQSP